MKIDEVFNGKFSAAEAEVQLKKILHQWWYNNSHAGLAISRGDLYEIVSARDRSRSLLDQLFSRLLEEAEVRRSNFSLFSSWKFVSLGEDCFSRSLTTRWGFKKSSGLGEKSRPFDLAVHPPGSLKALIDEDFAGYLDSEYLQFSERANHCFNRKYGVGFNHETGVEYAEDDFKKLKEVYARRVAIFQGDLLDTARTCFVLHLEGPSDKKWGDAMRLIDTILERSASVDPVIFCISTFKFGANIDCAARLGFERKGVYFIEKAYPFPKYVWHVSNRTEEGKEFEKNIAENVASLLTDHVDRLGGEYRPQGA
ncbi:hypothetical protein [Paracoccus litorisediminis]|uniref:Papain-like cysteine peptidase n=1 Tax=Paracoccus litorisediminis TaxID=2006130 RepID=A0A844HXH9_9RHOB|nr:hypothetical protein [Paracoccus litorisediminis]MTH62201.1 hypothetical protein [Paracoccus litorisediminis]